MKMKQKTFNMFFINGNKINFTKKWIIVAIVSALWFVFCSLFLSPEIRSIIIKYVEENITHKIINHSNWSDNLFNFALIGYCVYLFTFFIFILEKFFIINKVSSDKYNWETVFMVTITIFSIAIRVAGFSHKTGDYFTQSNWVTHLRENGIFEGFKTFPGNYNAIYMYFLAILSYLPSKYELWIMKIMSCVFDYICAFYSMKIIRQMTRSVKTGVLTYAIILFSPTVFINSGLWAQCDSMYAAFILISMFYLLNDRPCPAMLHFGIALSFKLQAIFPLPFILYIFIYKKISMKNLLYILIGFFGVSIPAWLFGWPLIKCVANYLAGTNTSGILTMNAPTIFTWGNLPVVMPVVFIAAVLFCIGFLIINKKSKLSNNTILLLFLFCNFTIPFFLPNMHERYFYVGEIAVLLYVMINPKRFWISFFVIMPSLATYTGYLYGTNPFSLQNLSFVMLAGVVIILKWLIEAILLEQGKNYDC
ncbi:MAG: hypothetical protein Ta2B_18030 [Termitinemataceae bacterium]|nr:MAG: hypothetical protein Ta2B_18030 [Termitinemataceae bacterium]